MPEDHPIPDRYCLSWRVRRSANEVTNLAIQEITAAHRADRYPRRISSRTAPARRFFKHLAHAEDQLARLRCEHGDQLAACITAVFPTRVVAEQLDFSDAGLELPIALQPEKPWRKPK